MSETKHTPGPWDDASKYAYCESIRIFAKEKYIATVAFQGDGQMEANARLIAAAPDLLAACEMAFGEFLKRPQHPRLIPQYDALKSSIDKAKGQS